MAGDCVVGEHVVGLGSGAVEGVECGFGCGRVSDFDSHLNGHLEKREVCGWFGCTLPSTPKHLQTHLAPLVVVEPQTHQDSEIKGIPLTALLVVRNLAKLGVSMRAGEVVASMVFCERFGGGAAQILGEIGE